MSVTQKRLTGWGRTAPTVARVLTTPDAEEIAKAESLRIQVGPVPAFSGGGSAAGAGAGPVPVSPGSGFWSR